MFLFCIEVYIKNRLNTFICSIQYLFRNCEIHFLFIGKQYVINVNKPIYITILKFLQNNSDVLNCCIILGSKIKFIKSSSLYCKYWSQEFELRNAGVL